MQKNVVASLILTIILGSTGIALGLYGITKTASISPLPILYPSEDLTKNQLPIVTITDPSNKDTVLNNITIRATIWSFYSYAVSILLNGTEIGTSLPLEWNSSTVADGWYNLTIVATNMLNKVGKDEIIIYVGDKDTPIVGILDPDYGETVWGNITIRALIFEENDYTISVLLNGSEIGTTLPLEWNSSTVSSGWWNITVIATDVSNNIGKDEVLIFVNTIPSGIIQTMQVINTTEFQHNSTGITENLPGSSLIINVSENSTIYATFTATHWLNASVVDVLIEVWLYINSTNLNSYQLRHQTANPQNTNYIRMVGHCEGLISGLSAGTYEIYILTRIGIGNDVFTSTSGYPRTLTVMEIAG
ncbi:MAG: hypothetical protein ACTSRG_24180 [Candidatus Helarchaeota archaeon]